MSSVVLFRANGFKIVQKQKTKILILRLKFQIDSSSAHNFEFEYINLKAQSDPKTIWYVSIGYGDLNHVEIKFCPDFYLEVDLIRTFKPTSNSCANR